MRRALASLLLLLGCSGPATPSPPPQPPPAVAEPAAEPARTPPSEPAPPPRAPSPPADPAPPAPESAPPGVSKAAPGSQAEIAASRNEEAKQLIVDRDYAQASAKLREAVARVPDPRYFFNLCMSLYLEGKLGEGLTACRAVEHNGPTSELKAKAEKLIAKIKAEAQRQGVRLE